MPTATDLITYDPSGAFLDNTGLRFSDWQALAPRLDLARRGILAEGVAGPSREASSAAAVAAEAAFFELPERTLDEYMERKATSPLGRLFQAAHRLQEATDRVVVIGSGCCGLLPRVLLDACCDPYFNELSRGQRGARPRLYFTGNHGDNDATQGLLRLLTEGCRADRLGDRWALVAIGLDAELEATVAVGQFRGALQRFYGHDEAKAAEMVVSVAQSPEKTPRLRSSWDCGSVLEVPEGPSGRFSAFSPAGLLPAAILGLDVIRLLEGASALNDHFRKAPPGRNAVLDFAALNHLAERQCPATIRTWAIWPQALQTLGLWYDRLVSGSPGAVARSVRVITISPSCDPPRRGSQSRQGETRELVTNLVAHRWRCDPLLLEPSDPDGNVPVEGPGQTLPELMAAGIRATKEHQRSVGRPGADLHLPKINEYVVGQVLQMLMLATAVEERLQEIHSDDFLKSRRSTV